MKTVITYGTFDLFHVGHLNLLRRAKELGDYLIVAVSSDEFNLGKNKVCKIKDTDRMKIVEAIKYVDVSDSAGSQFFIMHKTSPHLAGQYAAFGKVIEGLETVNMIAETRTDWSDRPLEPQIMETVTVETFGESYPEPEKLNK